MKKNIFLLLILFLLSINTVSAANINYTLEITNDGQFKEQITYNIYNFKNIDGGGYNYQDKIYGDMQSFVDSSPYSNTNYNKTIKKNDNDYIITFNYDFNETDFKYSYILEKCFDSFHFESTDNYYYFFTNGTFYCTDSDGISVVVKTNYKVVSNNATEKFGNNYKWIFNNDVANINIKIDKKANLNEQKVINSNNYLLYILISLFLISVIFIISFAITKNKKNNRI